jgi:hypothetical protein
MVKLITLSGDPVTGELVYPNEFSIKTKLSDKTMLINKNHIRNIIVREKNILNTADGRIIYTRKSLAAVEGNPNNWEVIINPWKAEKSTEGGFKFSHEMMTGENAIAILKNSEDYSDATTIEASMATITNTGTFNIYFRIQDLSNLYMFSLRPQETNPSVRIRFWKRQRGQWINLGTGSHFKFERNVDYKVKVVIEGDDFSGYIDERLIEKASDRSFNKGKIGFEAFSSKAYFKNIFIYKD